MTATTLRAILISAVALGMELTLAGLARAPAADSGRQDEGGKKTMTKTDTGLQYLDVKEGTGEAPQPGQTCFVHYTGWLWEKDAKGKEFDSSKKRGEPFAFHVGRREVILGWDQGVMSMKVGGKRELLIPPDLGYGARGAGGVIPANATLLFEVELLGVMQKTKSGLEYRDVDVGTGPVPRPGQTCVVHYTGWLWRNARAKKFDSSVDRGQPFSFPVGEGRVIKGWDEGVAGMKVGGKRELLIPAELGYGARAQAATSRPTPPCSSRSSCSRSSDPIFRLTP